MTKNKSSTRYNSNIHEQSICKELNAIQTPNSGATIWKKGDCIQKDASLLIEAKCSMNSKQSFSIKKDWLYKNKSEMLQMNLENHCLCFNFEPAGDNFYIIDSKLMKFLVEKLELDYKEID